MVTNEKKIYKILLLILIAAQLVYTIYTFVYVKKGSHTDETWSYGLANAYYGYNISYDRGNYEKWLPGKMMWDYITVQEGEEFTYDSVYQNSKSDMHPFLYDMVLHTVCSFFPETFSWWYGFSLNLLFLAVTQVFLFLTMRKVTGSEVMALIACLLYGGGKGALLNFTLIRPYAMLTMLCMMFVYFSACCYDDLEKKGKLYKKHIIPAVITANLSFMTHYYGIAFVGVFTALFCIYLFCKKKIKAMLAYGVGMTAALGLALLVFPKTVSTVTGFGEKGGMLDGQRSFSPAVQIRILFSYLCEYNYGFKTGWYPTAFWNITLPLIGAAIVGVLMLAFPFRHEEKFWNLVRKIKEKLLLCLEYLKKANYIPFFVAGSCFAIFEVISHSVEVWLMGAHVMRYFSFVVPAIALVVVSLFGMIGSKVFKRKRVVQGITLGIVCLALGLVHWKTGYPYNFPMLGEVKDIVSETEGKNVLVVGMNPGVFSSEFASFTPMLYKADSVCFTSYVTIEDFVDREKDKIKKIDYLFVNLEVYELDDIELRMLNEHLGLEITNDENVGSVQAMAADETKENSKSEDEEITIVWEGEYETDCRESVKTLMGDRNYEVVGVLIGQKGGYYIFRLDS